ncbi:peptidase M10A and M12B matrixin and adamalysin [Candidatus Nitrosarchaeum limnium SFB1]|jgi:hypothetical protein|uniref:Peptidase M10A and M12B matrixin and adamalysin n=1 Tax=Candidatus Nitrosarchaeum limnium SFB1 TaxID=886738 RepID=F3KJX7_9ARCH|nr:peptidase M10A and M12B matrixin and adamalysin [Candidatus Nitrosarchaeum limnium SFB1]
MKSEFIVDVLSQKILLADINAIRKKQILDLTENNKLGLKQKTTFQNNDKKVTKTIIPFKKNHRKYIIVLSALTVSALVFSQGYLFSNHDSNPNISLQTKYLIENLRGDTTETWVSWDIIPNRVLTFTITGESASAEKINMIKDAILSEKSLLIDNSVLHKDTKGTFSTYYAGWQGAMQHASKNPTKIVIPQRFEYAEPYKGAADITINLSNARNGDGYSGYTKSIVEKNQILKSIITIYEVEKLNAEQISTITRHEFGHALGLAHSTAPEDLMFPTIETDYPYISSCDIDAIVLLYDGGKNSEVTCEI